jgi:FlaA1/EpsC-like NDP-sugar epimerase
MLLFLGIRLPLFKVFGLYKGLWRYEGMIDMQKTLASFTVGSVLFTFIIYKVFGHYSFPRSVVVLEWLLVTVMIGGVRFTLRSYKDYMRSKLKGGKRILVVGAGNAGEMIVRDMVKNPYYEYDPVVFIDDDPLKRGLTIHGVPIVGGCEMLEKAIKEFDPQEILIAVPSAKPSDMQGLIAEMTRFKLPISTLPNLKDVIEGKVSVSSIKTLELEDLLARPAVKVDTQRLHQRQDRHGHRRGRVYRLRDMPTGRRAWREGDNRVRTPREQHVRAGHRVRPERALRRVQAGRGRHP